MTQCNNCPIVQALKALLLYHIRGARWEKEGEYHETKFCLSNHDVPFIDFHVSGGWMDGHYWMSASFCDAAIETGEDGDTLLEEDFEGQYEEIIMANARKWLFDNVDKAVNVWAKRYSK